ncbi:hypothetical protein X963_4831 [Burkholderia pseudomallei MSHR7498]|nr:hypothetical protein X963_4831 [Burkholderia pseudomallei MSHR7498]
MRPSRLQDAAGPAFVTARRAREIGGMRREIVGRLDESAACDACRTMRCMEAPRR